MRILLIFIALFCVSCMPSSEEEITFTLKKVLNTNYKVWVGKGDGIIPFTFTSEYFDLEKRSNALEFKPVHYDTISKSFYVMDGDQFEIININRPYKLKFTE